VRLAGIAHRFVGRTKQTVQLPELRPRRLPLVAVQVVEATEPVCAVPASVRPTLLRQLSFTPHSSFFRFHRWGRRRSH